MSNKTIEDRASGAIMGAFIGDALALVLTGIVTISLNFAATTAIGSTAIPIPNPADTTMDSKQVNFPRQVLFSRSCFAPSLIAAVTMQRTFAAGWMSSSFRFSTEHR